jgi:hypothetical protein
LPHAPVTGLQTLSSIGRPAFWTALLNAPNASAGLRFCAIPHRKSILIASNFQLANRFASAS